MPRKAVGRAAVDLPWLCPNTDSLIALAESSASLVGSSSVDPALAVFLLRFAACDANSFGFAAGALHSAVLPDTAAAYLAATKSGVLPGESHALARVRAVAGRSGRIAASLAEQTRAAPADAAATVARIAPLGWYAVAAVDPFDAADPLADPDFPSRPVEVETDVWGLDHAAITRRLAARWRLPPWVATTIGSLTLPFRAASQLVSHPDMFAVVQLAVMEAERIGPSLGLARGADRAELLDHLRLDSRRVDQIV